MAKISPAPRTATRLEDRRATFANSSVVPSPRYAMTPNTLADGAGIGRKSSLLIARTRRAGTEEPEEAAVGRKTSLLRTRRAGTEEPDEGRKTSLLFRGRKAMMDEEEDDGFRAPSRAVTEVAALRPPQREYHQTQVPAADPNASASRPCPVAGSFRRV